MLVMLKSEDGTAHVFNTDYIKRMCECGGVVHFDFMESDREKGTLSPSNYNISYRIELGSREKCKAFMEFVINELQSGKKATIYNVKKEKGET